MCVLIQWLLSSNLVIVEYSTLYYCSHRVSQSRGLLEHCVTKAKTTRIWLASSRDCVSQIILKINHVWLPTTPLIHMIFMYMCSNDVQVYGDSLGLQREVPLMENVCLTLSP